MFTPQEELEDRKRAIKEAIVFYHKELNSGRYVKIIIERMNLGLEKLEGRLQKYETNF